VLLYYKPDLVLVVGDVNSTLACALTAAKLDIRVGHVEAGLRSFDRTMPEEYNRVLTDQIADLLFTPSRDANENLRREGIPDHRIHFVGNVMVDTLVRLLPKALERWHVTRSTPVTSAGSVRGLSGVEGFNVPRCQRYVLVTLHRPSNVDDPDTLREILLALVEIAREVPVVFPAHPRTRQRIGQFSLNPQLVTRNSQFRLIEPLGYLDFLALMRHAALVITDSGGIQEETTFLGVPCLTVRPNTERPITITQGTNRLVCTEREALLDAMRSTLNNDRRPLTANRRPELWDGRAAKRIVDVIRSYWPMFDS
jgi:UDP-N-acetylglucosamine 2-epimerase (non-hydrolysing)